MLATRKMERFQSSATDVEKKRTTLFLRQYPKDLFGQHSNSSRLPFLSDIFVSPFNLIFFMSHLQVQGQGGKEKEKMR